MLRTMLLYILPRKGKNTIIYTPTSTRGVIPVSLGPAGSALFNEPDDWDENDDELVLDPWGEPE